MFSEIERHSKVGGATLSEHLARGATFVHLLISAPDFFPECRVERASRWASLAFLVRSAASDEGERALLSVAAPSHPIIVVAPVSLLSFFFSLFRMFWPQGTVAAAHEDGVPFSLDGALPC